MLVGETKILELVLDEVNLFESCQWNRFPKLKKGQGLEDITFLSAMMDDGN